jgi:toxin ParE1/3/4
MRAQWSDEANIDIETLWDFIARDKVEAADRYVTELKAAADRYAQNPNMGQEDVKLSKRLNDSIRSFLYRNHRIYYATRNDEIRILRVLHCRQDKRSKF